MSLSSLKALERQASSRTAVNLDGSETVMLTLGQLAKKSSDFNQNLLLKHNDTNDSQAKKILALSTYDFADQMQLLKEINRSSTLDSRSSFGKSDACGFLENEHELIISALIEEAEENTSASFYKSYWKNMFAEWDKIKKSIRYSHMLPPRSSAYSSVDSLNYENKTSRKNFQDTKSRYANIVSNYILQLNHEDSTCLFTKLCKENIKDPFIVSKCWTFLHTFALKSRSEHTRDPFTWAVLSKQTLESLFTAPLEDLLHKLRDPAERKWVQAYYLLRSGTWRATPQPFSHVGEFSTLFSRYMEEEEQRDSRTSNEPTLLHFSRTFQGYKRAVLAVLTRDPSFQNSHILQSVEDVVWMRLNAVQPPSQRAIYTLERLQENVAREDAFWQHEAPSLLDNRSFEKWSTLDKFYVQLLCCDFARGIRELSKDHTHEVEAVHFSIAMLTSALLQTQQPASTLGDCLLSKSEVQEMVSAYARHFLKDGGDFPQQCMTALFYLAIPGLDIFEDQVRQVATDFHDRPQALKTLLGHREYYRLHPGLILNPNLAITFNVPSLLESIAHEFRGKKINNPVAAVMLFDLAARYFEEKFQSRPKAKACENAVCEIFIEQFKELMLQDAVLEGEDLIRLAREYRDEYQTKALANFTGFRHVFTIFTDIYYPFKRAHSENFLASVAPRILQAIKQLNVLSFDEQDRYEKAAALSNINTELLEVYLRVLPKIALETLLSARYVGRATRIKEAECLILFVQQCCVDLRMDINFSELFSLQRKINFE